MSQFILILIGITVILLTILLYAVFLYYSVTGTIHKRAPFVPVRKKVLPAIVSAVDLHEGSVLFDLGCGDGRVLKSAIKAIPSAKGIGVEINWMLVLFARWRTRKLSVSIVRGDIYAQDYSSATHIFCYLFPNMISKLEPILKSSCKPGTRIVLCDYEFPTLAPREITTLTTSDSALCKKLYTYIL